MSRFWRKRRDGEPDMRYTENRAEVRAWNELRTHLDEDQRKTLDEHGSFLVVGSEGREYRIVPGSPWAYVQPYDRAYGITAATPGYRAPYDRFFPASDAALSLKLLIETDEPAMRRVACH